MEEAILIALIEEQLCCGNYNLIHDNFYNLKEDIVELLYITIPDEFFNYEDIYDHIDELINDNKQTILQFNSFIEASACYSLDEYQKALSFVKSSAHSLVAITEGID